MIKSPRITTLWWLLAAILGLRLISMWLVPLIDTSEPRYAEIARLMVQTNDWITPWFKPGVPFWGKPPLSFWAAALSIKYLGVSAFAARLPSWLATLATVWLLAAYSRTYYSTRIASRATLIYCTCALVYILSGAVLTDPFLVLGTTWTMASLPMAQRHPAWYWRYGFFLGLSIGLLAKGPLALVLVAGPLVPWLLWYKPARSSLRALPWVKGLLLTVVISVPWYIAADIKTPGFLHYFIVGEHFLRFVDPGWTGDLYGTAHSHMRGTIWLYWILACLPWSPLALWLLVRSAFSSRQRTTLTQQLKRPWLGYLVAWSLFTPLFFTLAGNILWTYILPAMGAFSILLALALENRPSWQPAAKPADTPLASLSVPLPAHLPVHLSARLLPRLLVGLVPALAIAATVFAVVQPLQLGTQQRLIRVAQQHMHGKEHLFYVNKRPFSARFYSEEHAKRIRTSQLPGILSHDAPTLLAIPKHQVHDIQEKIKMPMKELYRNKKFVLVTIAPTDRQHGNMRHAPLIAEK